MADYVLTECPRCHDMVRCEIVCSWDSDHGAVSVWETTCPDCGVVEQLTETFLSTRTNLRRLQAYYKARARRDAWRGRMCNQ